MSRLVLVVIASASLACSNVVELGPRMDDGGAASAPDASQASSDCTVWEGEAQLRTEADVQALQGVCAVTGGVRVLGDELQDVSLPSLRTVAQFLAVESPTVRSFRAPRLESIGTTMMATRAPALERLELPQLMQVGGAMLVSDTSLEALDMPELQSAGSLHVHSNDSLLTFTLPSLREAGSLLVAQHARLQRVDLDLGGLFEPVDRVLVNGNESLRELVLEVDRVTGDLEIEENPALVTVSLRSLEEIGGELSVQDNAALTTLENNRSLDTGPVVFARNPRVAELALSLRDVAGGLTVSDCAALAQIDLASLREVEGGMQLSQLPLLRGSFPVLQTVGGSVDLHQLTGAGVVTFGGLHTVQGRFAPRFAPGSFLVHQTALTDIELPALRRVAEQIYVWDNPGLRGLALPALEDAPHVQISANAQIEAVSLPALASVERLTVREAPRLTRIELAGAEDLDRADLTDAPRLTELVAPRLSRAGTVRLDGVGLSVLDPATFPALRSVEELTVRDSADLTRIDVSQVLALGALGVSENPALTHIEGPSALAHAVITIAGNPSLASIRGFESLASGTLSIQAGRPLALPRFAMLVDATRLSLSGPIGPVDFPALATAGELYFATSSLSQLAFPALVEVTRLRVSSNPSLSGLSLPALRRVQTLWITVNRALPGCVTDDLLAQLEAGYPRASIVHGNGPPCAGP